MIMCFNVIIIVLYRYIDTHMQYGADDCGLYALAYMTALAYGEQPGSTIFNQKALRQHYLTCLDALKMVPFPILRKRRCTSKVRATFDLELYCVCRMPGFMSDLIECNTCKEWFHVNLCVTVPQHVLVNKALIWTCTNCN